MSDNHEVLAGVLILAGGLSTRMGSPKALLELPTGQTLLDYHVAQAKSLGVPILIADNDQDFTVNGSLNQNSLSKKISLRKNNTKNTANTQLLITHIKDYKPTKNSNLTKEKHSAGPLSAIMAGLRYFVDNDDFKNSFEVKDSGGQTTNSINNKWLLVISCDSLISASDVYQLIQNDIESTISLSKQIICLHDDDNIYPLLAMYSLQLTDELKAYLDNGQRRVMRFIKPKSHTITIPQAWSDLSNLNTPNQFKQACQQVFSKRPNSLPHS